MRRFVGRWFFDNRCHARAHDARRRRKVEDSHPTPLFAARTVFETGLALRPIYLPHAADERDARQRRYRADVRPAGAGREDRTLLGLLVRQVLSPESEPRKSATGGS